MTRPSLLSLTLLTTGLALVLAGCSFEFGDGHANEGGIGGSGSGSGEYAEGGMGGSGSGTTSGYGSIYVNDYRYYQIADNALAILDGEHVSPASIDEAGQGIPLGMVVEFLLGPDADAELNSGTVIRLEANHTVIGPVTSTDPLKVLNQRVIATDASFAELPLGDIEIGDLLAVSGLRDNQGRIRATRLAPADMGAPLQLLGTISNISDLSFNINNQPVSLAADPVIECEDALQANQAVLVRGGHELDDGTLVASLVRCLADGLSLHREVETLPDTLPATTDGFITAIDQESPLHVRLGRQWVDLSQVVDVLAGTIAALDLGTHLEVDGTLQLDTGVLQARRVRLRDRLALFELVAPISAILDNETLEMLQQQVIVFPASEAQQQLNALEAGDTVSIQGFMADGELIAMTLTPTLQTDISLSGALTAVDETTNELVITTLDYDGASAESITLLDAAGNLIGTLTGAVCALTLELLCPQTDQPPEYGELPEGTHAALLGSSFSSGMLQGGHLTLTLPDSDHAPSE